MKQFFITMTAIILLFGTECMWKSPCFAGEVVGRGITIRDLCCEYTKNPLGIDTPAPRFSWILESNRRSQMQSAYRILVADSEEKLDKDTGDKWDSSKVFSEKSVNIPYEGQPLTSGEKCYWKVRVWDKNGKASPWSKPATFEMGLLKESDWQGKLIGMRSDSSLSYIDGKFGQAGQFDGSVRVNVGHDSSLQPATAISMTAWIKVEQDLTDYWQHIYRRENYAANHYGMVFLAVGTEPGDKVGLWFGVGTDPGLGYTVGTVTDADMRDGNWHLAAATYDSSVSGQDNLFIYWDGEFRGSMEWSGLMATDNTQDATIGGGAGGAEPFIGGIDEVRIYDRALTTDEIKAMAGGSSVGSNLVGFWKLDGNLKNSVKGKDGKAAGKGAAGAMSPLLRKEFEVSKTLRRARAYISGLGWSELYINGKKVGDHVLDPATTDYDKQTLYVTYDVTNMLRKGANAVGVMLGNGWYSEPPPYCSRRYGDSPRLLMQMNLEFADGTRTSIKTDKTWKTASGPVIRNDLWGGESYDARLEQPGWDGPGFDDSGWDSVVIKTSPGGDMVSQLMPAIKVNQTIRPVKLTNPKPDIYVYDMGQLFGGWARLRVKGPEGTRVTIKYSARIFKDSGLVDKRRHPVPKETDYYILKGDRKGEVYEPRFTYHPVRYVQIEGYPGRPALENLEGKVVHSAVDMSGDFHCSNSLLNTIHKNVIWTLKNYLYGIPLDCLHREHWGWIEPASISSALYTRKQMPLFWMKFLSDIKNAQDADGVIPDVVPAYPQKNRTTGDPGFPGNYPILVWYVHQYYGDRHILEEHYCGMKRWLDHLTSIADNHLVTKGRYGDHMLPGESPGEEQFISTETPGPLIWTGYYYRDASIVSQVADILGKPEDAEYYSNLAENIKDAFNEKWLKVDTNQYATGSQTANLFPLVLGIVPKENEAGIVRNIIENIMEKRGGHLHTGHTGTVCMIEALTEHGFGNVMYKVATTTTYPGWGYMVAQGATTIWENWGLGRGDDLGSGAESMMMWSSIDGFFYNDLAGIKGPDYHGSDYMAPGFRQIEIKPYVLGDLTWASGSIKTVRGMVSSSWKRTHDSITLEVTIPVNSTAKVSVPKIGLQNVTVTESDKPVWKNHRYVKTASGITAGTETDDYVTFDVGSGVYRFQLKGRK